VDPQTSDERIIAHLGFARAVASRALDPRCRGADREDRDQARENAPLGILALDQMVDRLADDHANARRLGDGLQGIPGIDVDRSRIESNMVFGDCRPPLTARQFIDRCRKEGVLLDQASPQRWRMVTHRGVSSEDVDAAIDAVRQALGATPLQRLQATG